VLLLAIAAFVLLMIFQGGSDTLSAAGGAMPPLAVAGTAPPVANTSAPVTTPVQPQPGSTPVDPAPLAQAISVPPTSEEARAQLNALLDSMTAEEIQSIHRIALEKRSESQATPGETPAPVQPESTPVDTPPGPDDESAN